MLETENMYLCMDLSKADWHSYEDSFGTLEEKRLIRYIESIYQNSQRNTTTYPYSVMNRI